MNTAVIASTFRLHLTGTGLRLLIRDTLLDLANYSIMTVLEIDDAQHEQEIAEQKTCDEGASNAD